MGEDGKLFFSQSMGIMVDGKPIGLAKECMLTCSIEDDGSTKDNGVWDNPITGRAVVTNVGDPIHKLLNAMPRKVDVELRRDMGKMPRKMKKAYRVGDLYKRGTKWKRKAKAYARRFIYRLSDAEMVVTRKQFGVFEAIIKGRKI
jgi:hypothetical protein